MGYGTISLAPRSASSSEHMEQEELEPLNFHEWGSKYNETHNHPIGGKEWMASFAAWQYAEIMTKQKIIRSIGKAK